jgi:hypothetical protein
MKADKPDEAVKFKAGDRVRLSPKGNALFAHTAGPGPRVPADRVGTISRCVKPPVFTVWWDGRKTPDRFHEDFLELAEQKP